MSTDRPTIHAPVDQAAKDIWSEAAVVTGCTISALVEVLATSGALQVALDRDPELAVAARRLSADRRHTGPRASAAARNGRGR